MDWIFMGYLLTLFLIIGSNGDSSTCSVLCGPNDINHFKTDHTYTYSYNTVSFIDFDMSKKYESKKSGFKLSAEVVLDVLSPCEMILQVNNVSLKQLESEDSERNFDYFAANVSKHSLKFNIKNGKVEDICPSIEEQSWVLNIKRGIISALPYSVEEGEKTYYEFENDIHGVCKIKYVTNDGQLLRERDLNDCIHEEGPFYIPNETNPPATDNNPLDRFLNTQRCHYIMKIASAPTLVTCFEYFNYNPKINFKINGLATITQQLILNTVTATTQHLQSNTETKKLTIYMDFEGEILKYQKLEQVLEESTKLNDDQKEFLHKHNIIALIRNSTYEELMNNFEKIKNEKTIVIKLFLNTLLSAHTGESIKAFVEIKKEKLNINYYYSNWFQRLAIVMNPSKDLLISLQPLLLNDDKHDYGAFSGISSLVNTYCKLVPNCEDEPEVKYFLNYWDSILENVGHHDTPHNNEDLVQTLVAIGNAGRTNSISAIKSFIKESTLPINARITAMQSVRKMSCESVAEDINDVFKDKTNNNEIRITAFMNSLRCPSQKLLDQIVTLLQEEEYNEVTSFVWMFLNKASRLPKLWREKLSNALTNGNLISKYQPKTDDYIAYFENDEELPMLNSFAKVGAFASYKNKSPASLTVCFASRSLDDDFDQFSILANFRNIDNTIIYIVKESYDFFKKMNTSDEDDKNRDNTNMNEKIDEADSETNGDYLILRSFNNDIMLETRQSWLYDSVDLAITTMQGKHSINNSLDVLKTNEVYRFPTGTGFPLKIDIPSSLQFNSVGDFDLDTDASVLKLWMNFDVRSTLSSESSGVVTLDAHDVKTSAFVLLNFQLEINFNGTLGVENNQWKQFEIHNTSPKKMFTYDVEVKNIYKTLD